MGLISIFIVALGLSVDSFAVSVCTGVVTPAVRLRQSLRVGLILGLIQGIAPVLGGMVGAGLKTLIQSIDHWLAFVLMILVGGKMIFDGLRKKSLVPRRDQLHFRSLATMGIATSIDAVVVGIGFGLIGVKLWLAGTIIGLTTFFIASAGVLMGAHFSRLTRLRLEIFAGLVLIGIGLKILIEHLINKI